MRRPDSRQVRLPYPPDVWSRQPRPPRVPPPDAAVRASLAQVILQLELPFERPARPMRLRLVSPGGVGGPDPERPCDGCPKRARCGAPCSLLSPLLPEEETTAWNEVSSPALMAGRGVDEAFMTIPAVLVAEEPEDLWPEIVARYGGARLRGAMEGLTAQQRDVLDLYLGGLSRAEIGSGRGTSRQATHKVFWAAVGRLQRELGPLPPRAALALEAATSSTSTSCPPPGSTAHVDRPRRGDAAL